MASFDRRRFLELALGITAGQRLLGAADAAPFRKQERTMETTHPKTPSRMPVLFISHGSPMNAIEDNPWSRGFRALGERLPKPKAILAISAHWYVPGTFLTSNERPETIHDFGGFPRELFEMQYPAPGDVKLANEVVKLLGSGRASLRGDWGLDHGTWSVLHHLRPAADCPVVQLSIDGRLPPAEHVALGRALAPLRDQGVLILASGNLTHNLRFAMNAYRTGDFTTPDWASRFDAEATKAVEQHDTARLAKAVETPDGRMAHPSPDHYYPLLYAAGAAEHDPVSFPIEGFDAGSLSMKSVLYG